MDAAGFGLGSKLELLETGFGGGRLQAEEGDGAGRGRACLGDGSLACLAREREEGLEGSAGGDELELGEGEEDDGGDDDAARLKCRILTL